MATAVGRAKKQASRREVAIERSLGAEANPLWEELAEEAERYAKLVRKLKALSPNDPRRTELEGELYASLSHLAVHAKLLLERAEKALK